MSQECGAKARSNNYAACKRGITAIETEKTLNAIYPIKGSILGKGYDYGNSGHFESEGRIG